MRLVLADDHVLLLDTMQAYLKELAPGVEVITATSFGEAFQYVTRSEDLDLIILDVRMPGMNGLGGLKLMKERFPGLPVVVLSGHAGANQVREAMSYGAAGFIPKDLPGEAMVKALELVLAGGTFIPMVALSEETEETKNNAGTDHSDDELLSLLTKREYEVVTLLVSGQTNRKISVELNLTVSTVAFHLRGIYRKLDVSSRTEAMRAAMKLGMPL